MASESIVADDNSSNRASPLSNIIYSIKETVLLQLQSFMTKYPSSSTSADLSSIIIDSSSSSFSSATSHNELPSQSQSQSQSQSHGVHPIIKVFQEQDIGRHILLLTVPIITGCITLYKLDPTSPVPILIMLLLSLGFTATWNGILLREMYRRASNAIVQIGVSLILLAFFVVTGYLLPSSLVWISLLCFLLCIVPFIIAVYSTIGTSQT